VKVLAVVQARTGSTRLPGKVLLPVAGAPLLVRLLERVCAARTLSEVVVATTTAAADEPVRELARRAGVRCVSGHPTDLLDRHYQAAVECGLSEAAAGVVVKIPSDCPLIDPAVIDQVIGYYLASTGSQQTEAMKRRGTAVPQASIGSPPATPRSPSHPSGGEGDAALPLASQSFTREQPERFDFVSNLHPPTWPDGNDVEVVPLPVLAVAWREAARPHEREHTTPFIWDQPRRFRIGNVRWETGLDLSMSHRFTIDYPEDHAFVSAVYDALWTPRRPLFGLAEILDLLAARPEVYELNRRWAGVNWYRDHLGELATVGAEQTRRPEETPVH
jgi:spore coat polysaccharide biosynthesis protein SpsF